MGVGEGLGSGDHVVGGVGVRRWAAVGGGGGAESGLMYRLAAGEGGGLITGCMHFVKCRAINLGNYTSTPTPAAPPSPPGPFPPHITLWVLSPPPPRPFSLSPYQSHKQISLVAQWERCLRGGRGD